jgi:hypothetical protein
MMGGVVGIMFVPPIAIVNPSPIEFMLQFLQSVF